jgi:hypothetical protein
MSALAIYPQLSPQPEPLESVQVEINLDIKSERERAGRSSVLVKTSMLKLNDNVPFRTF